MLKLAFGCPSNRRLTAHCIASLKAAHIQQLGISAANCRKSELESLPLRLHGTEYELRRRERVTRTEVSSILGFRHAAMLSLKID